MLRTGQQSGVTVKDTTLINKSQKRRRLPKGRLDFRRSLVSGQEKHMLVSMSSQQEGSTKQ